MELGDAIRSRRMTRNFTNDPVDRSLIEECVDLASRAPSAGKSQGWGMVALSGASTARYWDSALPAEARSTFAFPGLLRADFVGVITADPGAYVARYSEADKSHTGLGEGVHKWAVPYWTVDASMAAMTFLLAVEERGLGALFLAVAHENEVRHALDIPSDVQIIGAVVVGVPASGTSRVGRSADRPRRSAQEILRWGGWTTDAD